VRAGTAQLVVAISHVLRDLGAVKALVASRPSSIPRIELVTVDLRVLAFTAAVSIVTGLLFGLAPALRSASPDLLSALKDAGRTAGAGASRRLRSVLVVVEVALALMLLIGAAGHPANRIVFELGERSRCRVVVRRSGAAALVVAILQMLRELLDDLVVAMPVDIDSFEPPPYDRLPVHSRPSTPARSPRSG